MRDNAWDFDIEAVWSFVSRGLSDAIGRTLLKGTTRSNLQCADGRGDGAWLERDDVRFRISVPYDRAGQRAFTVYGYDDIKPEFGSADNTLLSDLETGDPEALFQKAGKHPLLYLADGSPLAKYTASKRPLRIWTSDAACSAVPAIETGLTSPILPGRFWAADAMRWLEINGDTK